MKIVLFILVIFISNIIQGITGFAGTVLAMPFSIMLLGVDEAKFILNIITILSCSYIAITNYKCIQWKEIIKIIPTMLVGLLIGDYIFRSFPMKFLLTFYGVFIIAIALKGLFVKKHYDINNIILFIVLLASGIIHGMFISGGPLLIVYAANKLKEKAAFRSTISIVWIFLNSFLLINNFDYNFIFEYRDALNIILYSIPVLGLSLFIGNKLYAKLSQQSFLKISYVLLLVSGIFLL